MCFVTTYPLIDLSMGLGVLALYAKYSASIQISFSIIRELRFESKQLTVVISVFAILFMSLLIVIHVVHGRKYILIIAIIFM